ncbi:hypothetical protein OUZ56_005412 [Daphnia magna]|uniref:Uncharacterized protein n=1 Tax=Daphnia magna TaxID=35525 RepID=A0ABQ9YSY4_9CRUS|nr:hypothetical protein OUZ56_005412 [Daphnia magna]
MDGDNIRILKVWGSNLPKSQIAAHTTHMLIVLFSLQWPLLSLKSAVWIFLLLWVCHGHIPILWRLVTPVRSATFGQWFTW